ncbi:DUF1656 domain-containing protein [Frateuria aurantia]
MIDLSSDLDLMGVFVPPMGMIGIAVFLLLFLPVRMAMIRWRIYRLFWHRGLVDVCLYAVLLGITVVLLGLPRADLNLPF